MGGEGSKNILETHDGLDQSTLSGSVGSKDDVVLSLADDEVEILQDRLVRNRDAQIGDFKQNYVVHRTPIAQKSYCSQRTWFFKHRKKN